MTKRNLSRTFWCMLAFLLELISATLPSAQDAMTICQRIQNNDLKIRTLGPVGDKFMLLTTEGHLFYLPKANLRDVGTSRTTLTIDQVPVSANRVFGVNLDYSVRPGYLFFLLVDGKTKSEFLMTLKVESWEVILRAFNLDWMQSRREKIWAARRNRENLKLDFNLDFMVNKESSYCAEARRNVEEISSGWFGKKNEPRHATTQIVCLNDYSLTAEPTKEDLDSYELFNDTSGSPTVLTAFLMERVDKFYLYNLYDNGKLYCWIGGDEPEKYHSHLSNFIRCGPNFTDNTHKLEPPKNKAVERHTTTTSTSASQSSTDKQTRNDFRFWIIVTVVSLVAVLTLAYLLLVKKKKKKKTKRGNKRVKKRNRKDKHSNLGSSASSQIGSSDGASSNASSGGSSASSNSNATSGTSARIEGSSGKSTKASKSKLRSFMDTVSSVFKKNQKKIAKQGTKVKKAKENKKKEKERSKK